MDAAIVAQFRLLGDKLDLSKTDIKQPRTHFFLFITEGQSYLNSWLYYIIPMAKVTNLILPFEIFDKIDINKSYR